MLTIVLFRIGSTDPDAYRTFTEIITSKGLWVFGVEAYITPGYPCESHYVTTEDGYILHMFRIPYGIQGYLYFHVYRFIYLMSVMCNLDDQYYFSTGYWIHHSRMLFVSPCFCAYYCRWILNYPNESLSYILADAGYVDE